MEDELKQEKLKNKKLWTSLQSLTDKYNDKNKIKAKITVNFIPIWNFNLNLRIWISSVSPLGGWQSITLGTKPMSTREFWICFSKRKNLKKFWWRKKGGANNLRRKTRSSTTKFTARKRKNSEWRGTSNTRLTKRRAFSPKYWSIEILRTSSDRESPKPS